MIKLTVTCDLCRQVDVTNLDAAASVDEAVISINVSLRKQRWLTAGALMLCPRCAVSHTATPSRAAP